MTEPTAGYTVAAPDVSTRDVLDALTATHEAAPYREAIARDGLERVAADELRDLIAGGHLFATEDAAEAQAGDVLDRDPFADPQVLSITAEDVAEHLVRLGWNEPAPRPLFDAEGPRAQRRRADLAAGRLPDLADLEADVAAIEADGAAALADLAALSDDDRLGARPVSRDDQADDSDRDDLREALYALTRAVERFRDIIPAGDITHGDAVDLTGDADELVHQLHRLTHAQGGRE